jgi:hypothetical protein
MELTATLPDARLPAHLEVSGLLRSAESLGGFATVLKKGEREGGTILVVLSERSANPRVFERMPALDGTRKWSCAKTQDADNISEFQEYLDRRARQDPDLWIIELDVANGERLIS